MSQNWGNFYRSLGMLGSVMMQKRSQEFNALEALKDRMFRQPLVDAQTEYYKKRGHSF